MKTLKIVIPSFSRPKTCYTVQYLLKWGVRDFTVLLHDQEQKDMYLAAGIVPEENIVVSGVERGITNQRNFIVNEFVPKGEWFITLDDNIRHFKKVIAKYYNNLDELPVEDPSITQRDFNYEIAAWEMLEIVKQDIKKCEQIGAKYGGFASVDNYFFNAKKYKTVGYVISKAAYIFNDENAFYDPDLEAMEDFGFTAHQLEKNGKLLINGWVKPVCKHYEEGGIGTYENRVPRKIVDCEYLMKKYPNMFRYKEKKGCHPKAEIQLRFTNEQQVAQWKESQSQGSLF